MQPGETMKIEITKPLKLSSQEESLLDMHSFLNLMNVLIGELIFFGDYLGDSELMKASIEKCHEIAESLADRDKALSYARGVGSFKQLIRDDIRQALDRHPDKKKTAKTESFVNNINSIFGIMDVRVREILARADEPEKWVTYAINQLTANFVNVFTAIEKNSKGRYHIVYNIASKDAIDYFVSLEINSVDGNTITIPAIFQDVMRDLIANARKYTNPGGSILAGLNDDGKTLKFVVEDTGRGIPEDQIESVVDFGCRATNAQNKETKGGGFGLTKAYYITRQLHGRLWIESEENHGTKITIHIPRPTAA